MGYKFKPSKQQKAAYANQVASIETFCNEHNIVRSARGDSFYFTVNNINYRVSNHTVDASDKGMYREAFNGERIKVRETYHPAIDDRVYITAGKTRIEQIYNDLKAGFTLNKRGYRV
ncbi:MAG: hypothetical protein EOM11_09680 [Erysipelotrichia bacterium]|nr:hypothetical protein [Erysipelotrichia bacterium]